MCKGAHKIHNSIDYSRPLTPAPSDTCSMPTVHSRHCAVVLSQVQGARCCAIVIFSSLTNMLHWHVCKAGSHTSLLQNNTSGPLRTWWNTSARLEPLKCNACWGECTIMRVAHFAHVQRAAFSDGTWGPTVIGPPKPKLRCTLGRLCSVHTQDWGHCTAAMAE